MTRRCFAFVAIVFASSSAHAADYWVGANRNGPGTGAMDDPWPTIADADPMLAPGDVVHVLPGEYEGSFETLTSGSEGAPIVFVSEEKWDAVLVASDGGWIARGDWVEIVDFQYTGAAAVGMLALGNHVRYVGNWVHHLEPACDGNGGAGIDAGNYDAEQCDMIGNIVHDVWAIDDDGLPCNRVQGLYHSIDGGTIANNITWNISGFGVHLWHRATNVTITNNLVFAAGRGGMVIGADINNGGFADNVLVANNIVMHSPIGISEFGETGLGNRYVANLMFDNDENFRLLNDLVDEDTILADPGLVDFQLDGSGDYHLAMGSPAIDAGIVEGAPPTDLDGVPRPQGEGIDIGPYEVPVDAGTTGGDESSSDDGTATGESSGSEASASAGDEASDTSTSTSLGGETSEASSSTAGERDDGGSGCGCTTEVPARDVAWLVVVIAFWRRDRARRHGRRSSRQ
jgi:hypothetical protein